MTNISSLMSFGSLYRPLMSLFSLFHQIITFHTYRNKMYNPFPLFTAILHFPKPMSSKCIVVAYVFTIFLVVACYHGNMKAAMAAPRIKPRFSSLAELAEDNETVILMYGGGSPRSTIEVRDL